MQNKTPTPPPQGSSMNIADVYYVLFKHKWKIAISAVLGFAAAVMMFATTAPMYHSEAKLMVRWVKPERSLGVTEAESRVMPVDRGESIMLGEAEILTSEDVALGVVDAIGADKFVNTSAGHTNREAAARILKAGLTVEPPRRGGNIMKVVYQNKDPQLVQKVLRQIIDVYLEKHKAMRSAGDVDAFLSKQTDDMRARVNATDEELRKLKQKAKVMLAVEDSKRAYVDQFNRLKMEKLSAEVELEERRTALQIYQKAMSPGAAAAGEGSTNAVAAAMATASRPKVPSDIADEYRWLKERLEIFRRREQEMAFGLTPDSPQIKSFHTNIVVMEEQKKEMEAKHPALLDQPTIARSGAPTSPNQGPIDLVTESAHVASLEAKIKTLDSQLQKLKVDADGIDSMESEIVQLQRKKDQEEALFKNLSLSLAQAHLDEEVLAGKLSNISEVQSPSAAGRDASTLQKRMGMAIGLGLVGGVALAFFLELIIDQSVRKPGEIETRYRLPVFLSIPQLRANSRRALGNGRAQLKAPDAAVEAEKSLALTANGNGSPEIAPWQENHELHPFSEALRDRLVTFFEMKNMTHKPKLIALTSCSRGAGVTTLAAGLAASLSETGEGNVLLVDMNIERATAHPFYKGKPACGLSDVLEHDKRLAALVQDKLYMVSGSSADERLPRILPKRFTHLVPKLQASDYDYIIFDMPPIDQTSVTPRLAGFMDMVFLVVEGEKTNREWIRQASSLLQQSKANVGAVFNKRRNYVPRWLHQEF